MQMPGRPRVATGLLSPRHALSLPLQVYGHQHGASADALVEAGGPNCCRAGREGNRLGPRAPAAGSQLRAAGTCPGTSGLPQSGPEIPPRIAKDGGLLLPERRRGRTAVDDFCYTQALFVFRSGEFDG